MIPDAELPVVPATSHGLLHGPIALRAHEEVTPGAPSLVRLERRRLTRPAPRSALSPARPPTRKTVGTNAIT
jgi:hypothetical protein